MAFLFMYTSIRQFYNSIAWHRCRESYAKKKKYLCERCLARGIVKEGSQVHHKKRLTLENINNSSITLNEDNLELLCRECHEAEHASDRSRMFSKRRYYIDKKTGDVILKESPPSKQ